MTTLPIFRFGPTEYPYTERLEWYTRIFQSSAGLEERDRLRIHPRRGMEYLHSALSVPEKLAFDGLIHKHGIGPYLMPLWWHGSRVIFAFSSAGTIFVTIGADAVDAGEWQVDGLTIAEQEIVLIDGDVAFSFTAEVAMVDSDLRVWGFQGSGELPAGITNNAIAYPARPARLSPQSVQTAITSHYQRLPIVAELVDYVAPDEASGFTAFESLPLLDYRPDQPVDWQEVAVDFLVGRVDFSVGKVDVTDEAGRPFFGRSQRYWYIEEPQTLKDHRAFLQEVGGAHGAFWCPTWGQDLDVVAVSGDTISVRWPDGMTWDDDYQGIAGRGTIYIYGRDGSGAFRILSSVGVTDGVETLLLSGTPPEEPILCSWLELVRLAFDEVAIQHYSGDVKEIRMAMQGLTQAEAASTVASVSLSGGEAVSPTTVAGYVEEE